MRGLHWCPWLAYGAGRTVVLDTFLHIREPKAKPNAVSGDQRTGLRGPTPTRFRFYFLGDTVAQCDVRQSGLVCIAIYPSNGICCCAASPFQSMASAARIYVVQKKGCLHRLLVYSAMQLDGLYVEQKETQPC